MERSIVAKGLTFVSAALSLFFVPAPSDGGSGSLGSSTVCATGTCCDQTGAICNDGGSTEQTNRYYKKEGACPS